MKGPREVSHKATKAHSISTKKVLCSKRNAQKKLEEHGEAFWNSLFDDGNLVKQSQRLPSASQTYLNQHKPPVLNGLTQKENDLISKFVNKKKQLCNKSVESCPQVNNDLHNVNPSNHKISQLSVHAVPSAFNNKPDSTRLKVVSPVNQVSTPLPTASNVPYKRLDERQLDKTQTAEDDARIKQEFNNIVRDIRKMTLPCLGKFERIKIQDLELKATGRKQSKHRKMPLPELRSRRAAAEKSIQKNMEKESELGVKLFHGKKTLFQAKKTKRQELYSKNVRKTEGAVFSARNIGYERNGSVRLSRNFRNKHISN